MKLSRNVIQRGVCGEQEKTGSIVLEDKKIFVRNILGDGYKWARVTTRRVISKRLIWCGKPGKDQFW